MLKKCSSETFLKGNLLITLGNTLSPMQYHSIYKVPNGKLLRVSLRFDTKTNLVSQVRITGDFFAYPEESIEWLERDLENSTLDQDLLRTKIQSIIEKYGIRFIGVDAEGLTQALLRCKP
jgi:lipoate-protein ligase A